MHDREIPVITSIIPIKMHHADESCSNDSKMQGAGFFDNQSSNIFSTGRKVFQDL